MLATDTTGGNSLALEGGTDEKIPSLSEIFSESHPEIQPPIQGTNPENTVAEHSPFIYLQWEPGHRNSPVVSEKRCTVCWIVPCTAIDPYTAFNIPVDLFSRNGMHGKDCLFVYSFEDPWCQISVQALRILQGSSYG